MHVEKYPRGALGHMFAHYDRSHPGSESKIDSTKTHLNYNAAQNDQPLPQKEFVEQRLSQIKVHKRKDVNIFCDWVITAPKTLEEHEYDTFFREAYRFMSERYGKENVISAYVHMDESQPHMHFAFIPVTIDKKKHKPKLCAKEVITKRELITIHKDMTKYMQEVFGRDIKILNGATELGNVTVQELRSNKEKVKAIQDTVITEKTAELEKKRNSVTGKIFGSDTVTITGEELEHIQDIMQQSTAIVENVENILQQADNAKTQAEWDRGTAEQLCFQADVYRREEESKIESRKKALEERNHALDEREQQLDTQEHDLSLREKDAEEKFLTANAREQWVRDEREKLQKRSDHLDQREKEILTREDEPFGYYNSLLHTKDVEISEKDDKIRQLTEDNREKDDIISKIRRNFMDAITKHKHEQKEAEERYRRELAEKDSLIESLKSKLKHAYAVIMHICNSIVCLAEPTPEYSDFIADLEPKQRLLIEGAWRYGADEAEAEGFDEYAENIRTRGGISEKIRLEMDKLGYHEAKKEQSYGMER